MGFKLLTVDEIITIEDTGCLGCDEENIQHPMVCDKCGRDTCERCMISAGNSVSGICPQCLKSYRDKDEYPPVTEI